MNVLKKIFYFPLTRIIIGIIVIAAVNGFLTNFRGGVFKSDLFPTVWKNLIAVIISLAFVIFSYICLYKFYEKRNITELYFKGVLKKIFFGIILGAILQSLTILVIYLNGGYSIVSINNSILFILPSLTMAFSSAVIEEILFRGIIFRITEEYLGSYITLLITAILFGAIHLLNPNSSLIAGIGLAIQAGLLLGVAYMYSRNLWFPIAIHFAWNFTQSGVFGATVSGIKVSKSLIVSNLHGEAWYTGGQFGPEGSIQATVFCLIATIILLYLSKKKGNVLKPIWNK